MRVGVLLGCSVLLVACGERATPSRDRPAAAPIVRPATATPAFPPARADGRAWPRVPAALRHRIPRVVLAARAPEATVRATGCTAFREAGARLLGAHIDDIALTASFRVVPRDSGESDLHGRPIVRGCTAKWDRRAGRWRDVGCGHYAPDGGGDELAISGAGMTLCFDLLDKPRRMRDSPLMIWVKPPPRARWIVVRRAAGFAVAYPVRGRRPVRLVYRPGDALPWADSRMTAFPYLVLERSGRIQRLTTAGAEAG